MIEIRAARSTDVDAIVDVHVATWKVAYRGQLPDAFLDRLDESWPARAAIWSGAVASDDQRVVVAERDGRVVGFVSVGRPNDKSLAPVVGELYAIYVHPAAWSTGAGRALLLRGQDELRALGFREAVLWVLDSNARARRFYEQAGWRADGATKTETRGDVTLREVRYSVAL